MIRLVVAVTLLALASPAFADRGDFAPHTPRLKREVTVSNEIVRIGDLVENAGVVAGVAIFRAPDLGFTGAVSVNRVLEAVAPHHLVGLDTRGIAEVIVIRASRAITKADVEARIINALSAQFRLGGGASFAVVFDNDVRTLHVDPSLTDDLRVLRLNYEQHSGRFDVTFELPVSGEGRRQALRFTGSLVETVEAVVLKHPLARGELAKASDLAVERRPKPEVAADRFATLAEAQGFAARKPMRAGQVMRRADFTKPELVARNETVTIVYEVPGIMLTVRGKALEAGAEGDIVNVLNVQTKRNVQATVAGPGRVVAFATPPRTSAKLASSARPESGNSLRQRPE